MLAPQTFSLPAHCRNLAQFFLHRYALHIGLTTEQTKPRSLCASWKRETFLLLQRSPSSAVNPSELDERAAFLLIPNPGARSRARPSRVILRPRSRGRARTWGICTRRAGKLYRARSRLYPRRFLQVNTRWKALAEIYTMHSFAPFFNLKISAKNRQHFFAIE